MNSIEEIHNHITINRYINPEKQLHYAEELYKQGKKDNNLYYMAKALYYLGDSYLNLDNEDEALNYILKGIELQKKEKFLYLLAESYSLLGIIYFSKNDEYMAMDSFLRSIKAANEIGNNDLKGLVINYMGYIYMHLGEIETALDYFKKSFDYGSESEIDIEKIYEESIKYINMSSVYIELEDINNGKKYYDKFIKTMKKLPDGIIDIIYKYELEIRILFLEEKKEDILDLCNKIIEMKPGEKINLFESYYNIAKILLHYDEVDKAKIIIDMIYKQSVKKNNFTNIRKCVIIYLEYYDRAGQEKFKERVYESFYEKAVEEKSKSNISMLKGLNNRIRLAKLEAGEKIDDYKRQT